MLHKANIMKLTDGLFLKCASDVHANDYPNLAFESTIIDAGCMKLVQDPSQFDVLLLENLYGDVISDLCAGLVGGLGVVPGANIGQDLSIFEAVHGSAPDTVANFVKLVEMGHYDGLHFHRVIQDFMIQGGCPHSKDPMSRRAGTGGPGWQIPCEPSALALKHDKPGVLSMANAGRNTGGSQFFLTTVATPWLNGNHAVFGAVSEGMDVVHAIERCRKLPGDRPAEPQQIIRCSLVE